MEFCELFVFLSRVKFVKYFIKDTYHFVIYLIRNTILILDKFICKPKAYGTEIPFDIHFVLFKRLLLWCTV